MAIFNSYVELPEGTNIWPKGGLFTKVVANAVNYGSLLYFTFEFMSESRMQRMRHFHTFSSPGYDMGSRVAASVGKLFGPTG